MAPPTAVLRGSALRCAALLAGLAAAVDAAGDRFDGSGGLPPPGVGAACWRGVTNSTSALAAYMATDPCVAPCRPGAADSAVCECTDECAAASPCEKYNSSCYSTALNGTLCS